MALPKKRKTFPRKSPKKNHVVLFWGVLFSVILSFLSCWKPSFISFFDNKIYDTFLKSTCVGETTGVPVIVDIDEKSLAEFGQWPWPRYRIASLLDKLTQMGALSIGLDILFAEHDRTSIEAIQHDLMRDRGITLELRGLPEDFTDNDRILADALSKGPVVLGYMFLFEENANSDACLLHPLELTIPNNSRLPTDATSFTSAPGASCNLQVLSEAVTGAGFFNVTLDRDGILRRVPLIIEHKGKFYPNLALATLMRAKGVKHVLLAEDPYGSHSLYLQGTFIPLSSEGNMLVRFRGKGKTFGYISAADILSDRIAATQIEGKIVFIGTSAAGMKEFRSTPLDPTFPGVEVHATITDNILKKDFLFQPKWIPGFELILVIISGVLSTLLLGRTGAGWSSLILGLGAVGMWQASYWAFRGEGIFIPPSLALLALMCNFSALTSLKFSREERRVRERTRELLMAQEAIIESMSCLTETRDFETGGHIKRTRNYIMLLAQQLKSLPRFSEVLNDESIDLLCRSASLHDIGKVGVPDKILLKPGKLTDEEFEEMKKHTVYGRDAILSTKKKLQKSTFLHFAQEIAYTHHEKWDGSGYPQGLTGEEIPLSGRLMAIADTYDALTSKRVYKAQVPHEQAVKIITEAGGSHFDPELVDVFLKVEEQFQQIALRYADSDEEKAALVTSDSEDKTKIMPWPLRILKQYVA